jgi:hypothetical protein
LMWCSKIVFCFVLDKLSIVDDRSIPVVTQEEAFLQLAVHK